VVKLSFGIQRVWMAYGIRSITWSSEKSKEEHRRAKAAGESNDVSVISSDPKSAGMKSLG